MNLKFLIFSKKIHKLFFISIQISEWGKKSFPIETGDKMENYINESLCSKLEI